MQCSNINKWTVAWRWPSRAEICSSLIVILISFWRNCKQSYIKDGSKCVKWYINATGCWNTMLTSCQLAPTGNGLNKPIPYGHYNFIIIPVNHRKVSWSKLKCYVLGDYSCVIWYHFRSFVAVYADILETWSAVLGISGIFGKNVDPVSVQWVLSTLIQFFSCPVMTAYIFYLWSDE
jgi:hypothetical protein